MKKLLLSLSIGLGFFSTANAYWVKNVYVVGVQPNCDDNLKVRIFYGASASSEYNWNQAACSRDKLDAPLVRSFLSLGQGAMALGQKVDLQISDNDGRLIDMIVRGN
jgi:hypothetical protein